MLCLHLWGDVVRLDVQCNALPPAQPLTPPVWCCHWALLIFCFPFHCYTMYWLMWLLTKAHQPINESLNTLINYGELLAIRTAVILISRVDEIHAVIITEVSMVIVMALDSVIKACRQAGKVWRGKLLFGVSFHIASGQMEGEWEIE